MPSFTFNSDRRGGVRRFGADLLLLLLGVVLCHGLLFACLPRDARSYLHAFGLKMGLLRDRASPRVVILGGSNAAFGIDSPELEQQLGVPVVNAALHIGLGLPFMFGATEPLLGSGDVIVLSAEYDVLFGDMWAGGRALGKLLFERPSAARHLQPVNAEMALVHTSRALQDRLHTVLFRGGREAIGTSPVYSLDAFNGHGDVVAHLGRPSPSRVPPLIFKRHPVVYQPEVIAQLRDFVVRCRERGAQVYLVPPPVRHRDCAAGGRDLVKAYRRLRTELPDGVVLSAPGTFAFDGDTCFFDTAYHLNARGTGLRTALLVEVLHAVPPFSDRGAPGVTD